MKPNSEKMSGNFRVFGRAFTQRNDELQKRGSKHTGRKLILQEKQETKIIVYYTVETIRLSSLLKFVLRVFKAVVEFCKRSESFAVKVRKFYKT